MCTQLRTLPGTFLGLATNRSLLHTFPVPGLGMTLAWDRCAAKTGPVFTELGWHLGASPGTHSPYASLTQHLQFGGVWISLHPLWSLLDH